ncbi:MAG: GAF domain-containing protein [Methylococcales bacterium]|nr:GAF domain-containing protein [Methylococcales bacterium]
MSDYRIIKQLEKLIEIGIALSSKMTTDQLLELILEGARSIANTDGATLYRIQENSIKVEIVHSDSLNIRLGGKHGNVINIPPIPLYNKDGSPNLANIVSYSYHKKTTVNVADVYAKSDLFDFSGPKKFDSLNNYHSTSFLSVPLNNHENDTIGVSILTTLFQFFKSISSKPIRGKDDFLAAIKQQIGSKLQYQYSSLILNSSEKKYQEQIDVD